MPATAEEIIEAGVTALSMPARQAWLRALGNKCVAAWKDRVQEELPNNTLKTAYLDQLQVTDVTDDSVTFGLPGGTSKPPVLAFIAENGMSAHDMNEYLTRNGRTSWLLKGRVVQSKQGKVAFIPMERTHKQIEQRAARGDVDAVMRQVAALTETKERTGANGQRFTDWAGKGKRLGPGFGVRLKDEHKHDSLYRLIKIVALYSYNEKNRKPNEGNRFTLFRTVTENGKRWHREATPGAFIKEKFEALDYQRLIDEEGAPPEA